MLDRERSLRGTARYRGSMRLGMETPRIEGVGETVDARPNAARAAEDTHTRALKSLVGATLQRALVRIAAFGLHWFAIGGRARR
jgi:hypothetical protein